MVSTGSGRGPLEDLQVASLMVVPPLVARSRHDGRPRWAPTMVAHDGRPGWSPTMGAHDGRLRWATTMVAHDGRPGWSPTMGAHMVAYDGRLSRRASYVLVP